MCGARPGCRLVQEGGDTRRRRGRCSLRAQVGTRSRPPALDQTPRRPWLDCADGGHPHRPALRHRATPPRLGDARPRPHRSPGPTDRERGQQRHQRRAGTRRPRDVTRRADCPAPGSGVHRTAPAWLPRKRPGRCPARCPVPDQKSLARHAPNEVRADSSAWQSVWLLTRWSGVQIPLGPCSRDRSDVHGRRDSEQGHSDFRACRRRCHSLRYSVWNPRNSVVVPRTACVGSGVAGRGPTFGQPSAPAVSRSDPTCPAGDRRRVVTCSRSQDRRG